MNLQKINMVNIPHIFNVYWDNFPKSYLNLLTIKSFIYYHPAWKINIFINSNDIYNECKYLSSLINNKKINIINVKFNDLRIKKSNIKWYILSTMGGIWSDLDIIYLNSIHNILDQSLDSNIILFDSPNDYYTDGFYASNQNNKIFTDMIQSDSNLLNKNNLKIYNDSKIKILNARMIVPFKSIELKKIFKYNFSHKLYDCLGVKWFDGSSEAIKFLSNNHSLNNGSAISMLYTMFDQNAK